MYAHTGHGMEPLDGNRLNIPRLEKDSYNVKILIFFSSEFWLFWAFAPFWYENSKRRELVFQLRAAHVKMPRKISLNFF